MKTIRAVEVANLFQVESKPKPGSKKDDSLFVASKSSKLSFRELLNFLTSGTSHHLKDLKLMAQFANKTGQERESLKKLVKWLSLPAKKAKEALKGMTAAELESLQKLLDLSFEEILQRIAYLRPGKEQNKLQFDNLDPTSLRGTGKYFSADENINISTQELPEELKDGEGFKGKTNKLIAAGVEQATNKLIDLLQLSPEEARDKISKIKPGELQAVKETYLLLRKRRQPWLTQLTRKMELSGLAGPGDDGLAAVDKKKDQGLFAVKDELNQKAGKFKLLTREKLVRSESYTDHERISIKSGSAGVRAKAVNRVDQDTVGRIGAESRKICSAEKDIFKIKSLHQEEPAKASNLNSGALEQQSPRGIEVKGRLVNNPVSQVRAEEIIEQITRQIKAYHRSGKNEIEMKLEPEFLGKVRLHLKVEDGEVAVNFKVDNSFVKNQLEQNLQFLKANFLRQGFNVDHIQVETENFSSDFNQDQHTRQHSQQEEYNQQQNNSKEFENMSFEDMSREEIVRFLSEGDELLEGELPPLPSRWFLYNYRYRQLNLLA